jgi:hypothetical protein
MIPENRPPVYARVLRLRHVHPSGLPCFLFFEGTIALGALLALAELVSWWTVPVLPVAVAGTVKLNDLVAGALARTAPQPVAVAVNPAGSGLAGQPPAAPALPPRVAARQVSRDLSDVLDPADSPRQRFRQSGGRRYR